VTTLEAEVLNEFDLDIQIDGTDETHLPHRTKADAPQRVTDACGPTAVGTNVCSCTQCCPIPTARC
jgi:hypothetical protein